MHKNTVFLVIPKSIFLRLVSLTTFNDSNKNSIVDELYLQYVAVFRVVGLVTGEFLILSIYKKIKLIKSEVVARFKDKLVKAEIVNKDLVSDIDSVIALSEYKYEDCRILYFIVGYCQV